MQRKTKTICRRREVTSAALIHVENNIFFSFLVQLVKVSKEILHKPMNIVRAQVISCLTFNLISPLFLSISLSLRLLLSRCRYSPSLIRLYYNPRIRVPVQWLVIFKQSCSQTFKWLRCVNFSFIFWLFVIFLDAASAAQVFSFWLK